MSQSRPRRLAWALVAACCSAVLLGSLAAGKASAGSCGTANINFELGVTNTCSATTTLSGSTFNPLIVDGTIPGSVAVQGRATALTGAGSGVQGVTNSNGQSTFGVAGFPFLNGALLPGDGDEYTIHVQSSALAQSFRAVWDVGNWDGGGIVIPAGESGEPSSPHYQDLTATYISGKLVPLPYSDAAVRRHARAGADARSPEVTPAFAVLDSSSNPFRADFNRDRDKVRVVFLRARSVCTARPSSKASCSIEIQAINWPATPFGIPNSAPK